MSKYSTSGSSEGSNKYLSNEALLPLPLELETRDGAILWLGGGQRPPLKFEKRRRKEYIYIYRERERERGTNLAFLFNKITLRLP